MTRPVIPVSPGPDRPVTTTAEKRSNYDHGKDRMPEDVRTADCHTFATGEAYPDICMAEDCPAREYL